MNDERYNGWTNYETWAASLWMSNDQGSDEYWRERAQSAWDDTDEDESVEDRESEAVTALEAELEADSEDRAQEFISDQSNVFADLLNASLNRIDWREIARNYIADVERPETAPSDRTETVA